MSVVTSEVRNEREILICRIPWGWTKLRVVHTLSRFALSSGIVYGSWLISLVNISMFFEGEGSTMVIDDFHEA